MLLLSLVDSKKLPDHEKTLEHYIFFFWIILLLLMFLLLCRLVPGRLDYH